MLDGDVNTYNNCCVDCDGDIARDIEMVAKAKSETFDVVIFQNAENAYDLTGRYYRTDYARDTWTRTDEWLKRVHAYVGK